MSMLKRLINVITILWGLLIVFIVFALTFDDVSFNVAIGQMFSRAFKLSIIIFFGWVLILFVNYILFQKVTLWNKQGDK